MPNEKVQKLGTWTCNSCGQAEGVTSGVCPTCGPTQTTPVDKQAQVLAGVYEEPKTDSTPEA